MKKHKVRLNNFAGGLWTNKDSSEIPDNGFQKGLNVICDNGFAINSRLGSIIWETTVFATSPLFLYGYRQTNGTVHILTGVLNGAVDQRIFDYAIDGSTGAAIKTGLNKTGYLQMVSALDMCYILNGIAADKVLRYNGTTVADAGLPAPAGAPVLDMYDTNGNIPVGDYYYKYTYVYGSLGESNGSPVSAKLTLAGVNDEIKLKTIAVGGSEVTSRKIYRSTNATTGFKLVGIISDNVTTTFDDIEATTTDAIPDNLTVPPVGDFLLFAQSRLFVVKSTTNCFYWSELFQPDVFNAESFNHVQRDDGDIITGVAQVANLIVFFKRRATYVMTGTSPANWVIRNVSRTLGCIHHGTIAYGEQKIYFVSEEGVYSFDGIKLTFISEAINDIIKDGIERTFGTDNFFLWDTQNDWITARIAGQTVGHKLNEKNKTGLNLGTKIDSAISALASPGDLIIDPIKKEWKTDADFTSGTPNSIQTGHFWANGDEYLNDHFCVDPGSTNITEYSFETVASWNISSQGETSGLYLNVWYDKQHASFNYNSFQYDPRHGSYLARVRWDVKNDNYGVIQTDIVLKVEYWDSVNGVMTNKVGTQILWDGTLGSRNWGQEVLAPWVHNCIKGKKYKLRFYIGHNSTLPNYSTYLDSPEFEYNGASMTVWVVEQIFLSGSGLWTTTIVCLDLIESGVADYKVANAYWLSPQHATALEPTVKKQWRKIKLTGDFPTGTDFKVQVCGSDVWGGAFSADYDSLVQSPPAGGEFTADLIGVGLKRYIQVKVLLNTATATPTLVTPVIDDVTITYITADDLTVIPPQDSNNFWISQVVDCGQSISAWGQFRVTEGAGATITYTYWMRCGSSIVNLYAADWVAQTANAVIAMPVVARYVQWLVQMKCDDKTVTPTLSDLFFNYFVGAQTLLAPPTAIVFDRKYMVALTEKKQTENMLVLVYSLKNGSWTKFLYCKEDNSTTSIRSFALVETKLLCATCGGNKHILQLNTGNNDIGNLAINSYIQTKDFSFEPEQLKQLRELDFLGEMKLEPAVDGALLIDTYFDGLLKSSKSVSFANSEKIEKKKMQFDGSNQGRTLSIEIEHNQKNISWGLKNLVMEIWSYLRR